MSDIRTAPKDYICAWCAGAIREGSQYARRSEYNGIHYVARKYHQECEQAKIDEDLKGKQ